MAMGDGGDGKRAGGMGSGGDGGRRRWKREGWGGREPCQGGIAATGKREGGRERRRWGTAATRR
eukprot:4595407-Pleurochrysis_carterae.AAC.1